MGSGWTFVGRRKELDLAASWIKVGDGVLVLGDAGVGKTALARALARRAEETGRRVHYVMGRAASRDTPFSALSGAFGDTSTLAPGHTVRALLDALEAPGDVPPLLVIDDVQLVDEESARAVLELAAGRRAVVVATTQDATRATVAGRLWRDGHCERLELRGLDLEEVLELLEQTLDGPVDAATVRMFAQRSQGNPLMLRELVGAAREDGSLERRAAWVLVRPPPISGGIADLVRERLEGLDEPERDAMELLAATEPLALPVALELLDEKVLDRLETDGLVGVDTGSGAPELAIGHPMYGEVLRDAMPALRLRRFRLSVASRLEAAGDGQAHDVVRAALWRLEDGQRPDPQRLLVAARAARAYSLEAAERLARAATTDGSSLPAVLLLAEILTHRGRGEEASGLLATLPPDSLAQEDRAAVLYCMALGQGLAVGDPGQGVAMVEGVLAADRAATDHLRALHASLLAFDARFADALTRGGDLVEDQGVAAPARTLGAVGVVGATYWQGHFDRAVSYADQLLPVARAARSEVPYGEASLNLIAITALIEKGDHLGAERRTLTMRRQAEADSDPFAMPRTEYLLGRLALYRGQAETAVRRFRRTVATAGPFDQFIVRHLWSMVARAAATLGDHAGAEEALAAGADLIQMKPYEPEWDLAEAAVLASRLNITEAIDRATWAASVAADWGEWNVAIAGYHDAARYGAARVVLPAIQSVPFVDGELPACYLEHVVALAANDGDALDAVARRFEGVGALGYAVEAADEASLAHRQGQQERAATRSAWHGRDLRDRCEEASSPWLTGAASSVSLTARERQVAALAMEGLPDAEIASRLGMSVRTAQTHLSRCYTKLGVHSRSQLASVLPGRTGLS